MRHAGHGIRRSLLLTGLAVLLAACGTTDPADFPQDALSPEGPTARLADDLWRIVFPVAVGVFVLVQGLILVAVFRFRARPEQGDELPKQVAGNTRFEILWTAIPAAILAVIAVPTVQGIFALASEPDPAERIDVRVIGKQYWWDFEYLDTGVVTANELVIPVDTPVYLELDGIGEYELADGTVTRPANLVLHSFWVPRLAPKLDYVPNHRNYLTIEAERAGTYRGQCAEFCGLSHANMRFLVRAYEQDEYDDWLAAQAEPAAEAAGAVAEGSELVGANCLICHSIQGHPQNRGERIGPNLTHLMSRETFASGIFDLDDTEQLRRWIRNAPGEKPGAQMNPFPDLGDEDLDAIIAYLRTLE
jgi:cytochrome c oxidase subunit 2